MAAVELRGDDFYAALEERRKSGQDWSTTTETSLKKCVCVRKHTREMKWAKRNGDLG